MSSRPHVYAMIRRQSEGSTRRVPLGITAEVRAFYPHDADVNEVLSAISDASEQAVLEYLNQVSEKK